jgi:hypothetical protein
MPKANYQRTPMFSEQILTVMHNIRISICVRDVWTSVAYGMTEITVKIGGKVAEWSTECERA